MANFNIKPSVLSYINTAQTSAIDAVLDCLEDSGMYLRTPTYQDNNSLPTMTGHKSYITATSSIDVEIPLSAIDNGDGTYSPATSSHTFTYDKVEQEFDKSAPHIMFECILGSLLSASTDLFVPRVELFSNASGDFDYAGAELIGVNRTRISWSSAENVQGVLEELRTSAVTIINNEGIVQHSKLTGLSGDDHEHYVLNKPDRGTQLINSNLMLSATRQLRISAVDTEGFAKFDSNGVLSGGYGINSTDIDDFQESVEDVVGALVQDNSSISWTYDDVNGTLQAFAISSAGVSAHDGLFGLEDDDHLQYLLLSGRGGQVIEDDIDIDGTLSATGNATFDSNVTLNNLIATRLVATDASKNISSVSNLSNYITGTTNQVSITNDGDGSITVSLPQDINTFSTPTFEELTLSAFSTEGFVKNTSSGLLSGGNSIFPSDLDGFNENEVVFGGSGGILDQSDKFKFVESSSILSLSANTASTTDGFLYANNAGQKSVVIGKSGEHGILNMYSSTGVEGIRLYTSGDSWFLNDVGFGTTNPVVPVHISGNIDGAFDGLRLFNINTGTGAHSYLRIGESTTGDKHGLIYYFNTNYSGSAIHPANSFHVAANSGATLSLGTVGAKHVAFYTNNTERMRLISDGNLGIGTDSPGTSNRLHVTSSYGNGGTSITSVNNGSGVGTHYAALFQATASGTGTSNVGLRVDASGGADDNIGVWINSGGLNVGFALTDSPGNGNIIASGNISAGIATASAKLHIAGSTGTIPTVLTGTTGILQNSGSVTRLSLLSTITNGSSILDFSDAALQDAGNIAYNHGTDTITLATEATNRVWINATGLGVGITPSHRLHIKGTGTTSQSYIQVEDSASQGQFRVFSDSSGHALMTIADTGGNIRIRLTGGTASSDTNYILNSQTIIGASTYAQTAPQLVITDGGVAPTLASDTRFVVQNNDTNTDVCRVNIIGGTAGWSVLDFGDSGNASAGQISYYHQDNKMYFYTSGTTSATLYQSGGTVFSLESATSNWVLWPTQAAAPTATTRSIGTKLVLYPSHSGTTVLDYAIGIEGNTMWFSTSANTTQFKFYIGAVANVPVEKFRIGNSVITSYVNRIHFNAGSTGTISTDTDEILLKSHNSSTNYFQVDLSSAEFHANDGSLANFNTVSSQTASNGITIGSMNFYGKDSVGTDTKYAFITASSQVITNTLEDGRLTFGTINGGSAQNVFYIQDNILKVLGNLDVDGSFTFAGSLTVNGVATFNQDVILADNRHIDLGTGLSLETFSGGTVGQILIKNAGTTTTTLNYVQASFRVPIDIYNASAADKLWLDFRNTYSGTYYPTVRSDNANEFVMIHSPHIPYLQNGTYGYTGTTVGAQILYAGDPDLNKYWYLGARSAVGGDFSLYSFDPLGSEVMRWTSSTITTYKSLYVSDYSTSTQFYTSGSFTLTTAGSGSGFSTTNTVTARWVRIGNVVSLYLPALEGTSNGTTMRLYGIPSSIRPSSTKHLGILTVVNGGTYLQLGAAYIDAGGDHIKFMLWNGSVFQTSGWTNSGAKGISYPAIIEGPTFVYSLD